MRPSRLGSLTTAFYDSQPGVILDYDAAGDLVSLEILDASRLVTEFGRVEYQTTG